MASKHLGEAGCSYSNKGNSNEKDYTIKLFKSLHDIKSLKESNAELLEKINIVQDRAIKKGKMNPETKKLLKSYYKTADNEAKNEENVLRNALEIVKEIRKIRNEKVKSLMQSQKSSTFLKLLQISATRIPVWFPINDDESPPLLWGAMEPPMSYVAKKGDLVAALVKQSGEDRWIIAEAVSFENGKYKVEDIDVKEVDRNFTLDKKFVKPLPLMRADPVISPEAIFCKNQFVLAMYPQTTCFFKALVKAPPKTSLDGYEVLFEDDNKQYTIMMVVHQRYVVSYPSSELAHTDDECVTTMMNNFNLHNTID